MNRNRHRILAVAAVLTALAAAPALADFDQAMNYFKGGKYVEAAAEFQALVDSSPSYPYGYYMLGLSFMKMDKPGDAETNFLKAIELDGDRFEFHHGLASAYFDQKKYDKTVATLRTAEDLAQGSPNTKFALYDLRGRAYAGLEKWADAAADLEQAKAIKATPAVLSTLGASYYELGHNDKAVPVLREALKAMPKNDTVLLRLTNALLNMGAEASSDAQKQKYYDEALNHAEQYQKQNAGEFEAYNLVGRAALGAKQYDRAERAFTTVLEKKPDYCYAMVNLGKTQIAEQRWADAEATLRRGVTCAPRMAVIHESLGFALQKQDRLDEALASYEAAYAIKPTPGVERMIEIAKENIDIAKHNQEMDEEARKQREAELAAQREFEEQQKKIEEYKKRTEKDD